MMSFLFSRAWVPVHHFSRTLVSVPLFSLSRLPMLPFAPTSVPVQPVPKLYALLRRPAWLREAWLSFRLPEGFSTHRPALIH
jgi:hypothetical protein